jgi:hypothetical protein
MIIYDFDFVSIAAAPLETDAPLTIDPDAVLPFTVTPQRFQFVAGWNRQVLQSNGCIEQPQLGQSRFLDISRQLAGKPTVPNLFCFPVAKACDHAETSYSREYIRQANILQTVRA